MKSIFLTVLIFIVVFVLAGNDFVSIIGEKWFHYTSYIAFALVMLCAILITIFYKSSKRTGAEADGQREEEHDKN